jgi:methionyl-tRNA formyltransferase
VRVIFCGTPDYAVPSLAALMQSRHEVVAVVSQPDKPKGRSNTPTPPPVAAAALAAGFPKDKIFQPRSINRPITLEKLRALSPDVLCVVAYGNLLKQESLSLPKHFCLNAHGSLLPRHRGAAPIQAALQSGDDQTGVSMMKMELGLDTGPVMLLRPLPIAAEDNAGTLHDKLAALSAQGFIEALDLIEAGNVQFTPQDESLASYAAKLEKSSGVIDWNKSAVEIDRFIRAMTPWPGAWTTAMPDGAKAFRVRIAKAKPATGAHTMPAGSGMVVANTGLVVTCGKGFLDILELQPEGKRSMGVAEFLRGAGRNMGNGSQWK